MKNTILLWGLFLVALFLVSCNAPERSQEIADMLADGVITELEAERMKLILESAKDTNWPELLGTGISSVLATFFGIRYAPNSLILGKREASAVDKLAGTGR